MNYYKPYAYLYKHIADPAYLKSRFITQIPAGKKISLRDGDPETLDNKTLIRYIIEDDPTQTKDRMEQFETQFPWDGNPHNVEFIVGSGEGDDGGKTVSGSDHAELD